MKNQNLKIFYVDNDIMNMINSDFKFIEKKGWYSLYQNKKDNSFWRLEEQDKYSERYFIKLNTTAKWNSFNDELLKVELLKSSRGISTQKCIWNNCNKNSLNKLAYCETHSFKEMGIRK